MQRTTTSKWSTLKLGSILIVALVVAMWASLTGGGASFFSPKIEFVAYFANVNGLVKGSPVWVAGMEVGNVRTLEFVNLDSLRKIKVNFLVKESVWPLITMGSEVQLGSIGLLGDKMVEVIPGPTGGSPVNEGNVIPTRDVGSAASLFSAGTAAMEEAGELVDNINSVLGKMNRGEGTLGKLTTDEQLYLQMTELSRNLSVLARDLQQSQVTITKSIETTAEAVTQLSDQVSQNSGTIGKLMNDPHVYDNLASTTARLDSVMSKLNAAEGSLGLMVSDTGLYVQTVNLMTRVNNLVSDIQSDPRKYFKFSVF